MRLPPIRIRTKLEEGPLAELYGDREPFHYAGSSGEPLRSVSVFGNEEGPHWHYVAFGLKERFGIELSFRLAAASVENAVDAPGWPVALLQRLARLTIGTERPLGSGHYVCFEEPVDPAREIRCFAVVEDPQLAGPYLQAVGLHEDELLLISEDGYESFLRHRRHRHGRHPGRHHELPPEHRTAWRGEKARSATAVRRGWTRRGDAEHRRGGAGRAWRLSRP